MSETYCVILPASAEPPYQQAGQAVAKVMGSTAFDATHQIFTARGFVAENIPLEQADRISEALEGAGITALVLPQSRMAALPEPVEARRADFADQSATFHHAGGDSALAWDTLALTSVGIFREEIISTHIEEKGPTVGERAARIGLMAAGLPVGFGKTKKVEIENKETILYFLLDLFFAEPMMRIRVNPASFNYACLGENMAHSSTINFRIFLLEVLKRAPGALVNPGADHLRKNKPLALVRYEGAKDLDRESRWLLTARGYPTPRSG